MMHSAFILIGLTIYTDRFKQMALTGFKLKMLCSGLRLISFNGFVDKFLNA